MPAVKSSPAKPSVVGGPGYRHDIDGLRAVAILLVVVYHVWVGRVSGGVDAFLMISAFFLTGSFVRRLEGGRDLDIRGQWVRTFKRLLPPAAIVLLATLVAGLFILPENRLADLFRETWASLFYSENWRLAFEATDYYADKVAASPVQHFWSLSVQGQVFLLWPLLFLGIRYLSRRTGWNVRHSASAVFSFVFLASFAYSVVTTYTRQDFAYFDTGARLWEFAAGSLLAVALPWVRLPQWLRETLGWAGILALVLCGVLLDVQGGFPGYLALWPVLSVVAIILAGTGEGRPTCITRALQFKPLVALGNDAYALYLVHWPILIFAIQLRHGAKLSFFDGLLVVLAAILAARLLTWLVDDRLRYAPWANANRLRGLLVICLSILLVAGPTLLLSWSAQREHEARKAEIAAMDPTLTHPGAASLDANRTQPEAVSVPPIPLPTDLDAEWGSLPELCDDQFEMQFDLHGTACSFLPIEDPELTVAVVGDSHVEQWLAPIEDIALRQSWRTYSFLKGGCSLAFPSPESTGDPAQTAACNDWLTDVMTSLEDLTPDVVVTMGTRSAVASEHEDADFGDNELVPNGQVEALSTLESLGIPVVLLRDNPRFSFNAYECADAVLNGFADAAEQLGANPECGVSRGRALASDNPADDLVAPGVATVDMTDQLCFAGRCPAIIGNVFVYLDDNHLTSTYARTMATALEPRLMDAVSRARAWE